MTINSQYKDSMLTTIDNPYNPFVQFDEWNAFDISKGYNSTAYLARVTNTSHELSDEDVALAMSNAIAEILMFNITGNYIAITSESWTDRSSSVPDSGL